MGVTNIELFLRGGEPKTTFSGTPRRLRQTDEVLCLMAKLGHFLADFIALMQYCLAWIMTIARMCLEVSRGVVIKIRIWVNEVHSWNLIVTENS